MGPVAADLEVLEKPLQGVPEGLVGLERVAHDEAGDGSYADLGGLTDDLAAPIQVQALVDLLLELGGATLDSVVDLHAAGLGHPLQDLRIDDVGTGAAGPLDVEWILDQIVAELQRPSTVAREDVMGEVDLVAPVVVADEDSFLHDALDRLHAVLALPEWRRGAEAALERAAPADIEVERSAGHHVIGREIGHGKKIEVVLLVARGVVHRRAPISPAQAQDVAGLPLSLQVLDELDEGLLALA